MRTIAEINRALERLWRECPEDIPRPYAPVLRTEARPDGVVFVGLNPSASQKGWASVMSKAGRAEPSNVLEYFAWPPPVSFDEAVAHELEELARQHYGYFQVHRDVGQLPGVHWSHLDLFAYRETESVDLLPRMLKNPHGDELTAFGEAQLVLFEQLLELAKPRAVVVISARASRIYLHRRRPTSDSRRGCYRDSIGERKDVPVLFSETLSGRGMMGAFGRQRLCWHIGHVLGIEHLPPLRPQGRRLPHRRR